ncbi:hypothetical protein YB2330_005798 [Saitoella coloradoensis]
MFRKKPKVREPFVIPSTLAELGLYITPNDELRQIKNPELPYEYFQRNDTAYNEAYKAAVMKCAYDIVDERLQKLGMERHRIPLGANEDEPQTEVLVSSDLRTNAKKLVVLVPDGSRLGIWGDRILTTWTLHAGSMEDAVRRAQEAGYSAVICNPGELFYVPSQRRAMRLFETRASGSRTETIPGNASPQEHFRYVMEEVIKLAPAAKVVVLAHLFGTERVVSYFNANWNDWADHLTALGLAKTQHTAADTNDKAFRWFLANRAVNYEQALDDQDSSTEKVSNRAARNAGFGCATFSAECRFMDEVVAAALPFYFEFFEKMEKEGALTPYEAGESEEEEDDLAGEVDVEVEEVAVDSGLGGSGWE